MACYKWSLGFEENSRRSLPHLCSRFCPLDTRPDPSTPVLGDPAGASCCPVSCTHPFELKIGEHASRGWPPMASAP
jgi:hypothetical protein